MKLVRGEEETHRKEWLFMDSSDRRMPTRPLAHPCGLYMGETPPTTCVTRPISTQTHSHVVPRGNKAPTGPTASARDRARREPAGDHFARLEEPSPPPPGHPTPAAYLIDPREGPRFRGLFTGLPRPARRFRLPSPAFFSGGYSERQDEQREFEFEPEINLRQLPAFANQAWCQRIGSARI